VNGMLLLILILALLSAIAFLIPTYPPGEEMAPRSRKPRRGDMVMYEFDKLRRRLK